MIQNRGSICFTAGVVAVSMPLGVLFVWHFWQADELGVALRILMTALGVGMVLGSFANLIPLIRITRGS